MRNPIAPGRSFSFDAALVEGGVSFCVFSREARSVVVALDARSAEDWDTAFVVFVRQNVAGRSP